MISFLFGRQNLCCLSLYILEGYKHFAFGALLENLSLDFCTHTTALRWRGSVARCVGVSNIIMA